jgi:hypothetical protein
MLNLLGDPGLDGGGASISSRASVTFSRMDRENRNASCGTQPSAARRGWGARVVTSWPPRNTVPGGGSHRRARRRPSVDFPPPVGPTTTTN